MLPSLQSKHSLPAYLIVSVVLSALLNGCSHTKNYEYSAPDIYEPVYLTLPEYQQVEQEYINEKLYTSLENYVTGSPETRYATHIQSASLTATEEFLLSEGIVSERFEGYSSDLQFYTEQYADYPSNSYIYDWREWRYAQRPYSNVSYHIYTHYNPYDPYWFDPYWSYTRVRSYHAPFHPSYRYGGLYAFGYGYYPYYYRYGYYYPIYYPRPRDTYTAETSREERTGVRRNPSPRVPPASYSSFSSLLRPQSRTSIEPPSMDRIFNSQNRQPETRLRRNLTIPSYERGSSLPRVRIETSTRSTRPSIPSPSYSPNRSSFRSQSVSPGRNSTPLRQQSPSRGSNITSPRR